MEIPGLTVTDTKGCHVSAPLIHKASLSKVPEIWVVTLFRLIRAKFDRHELLSPNFVELACIRCWICWRQFVQSKAINSVGWTCSVFNPDDDGGHSDGQNTAESGFSNDHICLVEIIRKICMFLGAGTSFEQSAAEPAVHSRGHGRGKRGK